ncbi:MAG: metalloregulator ArsR/SmtB family transcription factor [Conexivisphaerales archaeon]|jgi:DNA-binding transcriptional ArsR family regulator
METIDIMGSSSRWKLLEALSDGEKSVSDLAEALHISNQGVLKHLSVLIEAGIVHEVREADGRKVGYALRNSVFLCRLDDEDSELLVYYRGKAKASTLAPETEFRANRLLKRFKLLLDKSY